MDGAPTFASVLARRRMCRDFVPEPVPADVLDRVLAAAFRGPSAGNTHGLDLVVLDGPEHTTRHWDVTLPPERRAAFPWPGLLRAPVLIEVIVDPDAYVERYAQPDKAHTGLGEGVEEWNVPYWFVDGGSAVMAMLMAAEAEGLGALFFGLFDHERAVLAGLGVPDERRGVGTIAVGWPRPGGRSPSRSARSGRPDPTEHVRVAAW